MPTIKEIASQGQFTGSRFHKHADLTIGKQHTIDESGPGTTVNTSIDCYVSGIYLGRKGDSVSIKQRYTVFVSYTERTQRAALSKIRDRIMMDFESNFPQFKISDIFVPEGALPIPAQEVAPGEDRSAYFYRGSDLFKRMFRQEVGRYRVESERAILNSRIKKIKKQFGLR